MIPGEMFIQDGEIELNAGRKTVTLTVSNTGDRPIQVGSHYHFFETNGALRFDRAAARGFRLNIPAGTARVRFGVPERVVLYVRSKPGQRAETYRELESILRLLRKLPPEEPNDFNLSTADQIIATFDSLSARIGLATVGLARAYASSGVRIVGVTVSIDA